MSKIERLLIFIGVMGLGGYCLKVIHYWVEHGCGLSWEARWMAASSGIWFALLALLAALILSRVKK